ncbi:MAG: arginyltransferase [Proteobacteria bacterium]|nr:arginyltransferase [Pseudomonadota bacterium]
MGTEKLVYDGLQRCPYLDGRVARMPLYRQLRPLTLKEADARFALAERRVGTCLYQTACPTCTECAGVRVLVNEFVPTKSQRRVWRRCHGRFRIEYGPATLSAQKLDLFNRHKLGRGLVDSADKEMTPVGYVSWLVRSCFHTVEMRYFLDEQLAGVGILDFGSQGVSSVYFYFDPHKEVARLSPGVYSALKEIELAKATGRKYLYLGLYVTDCRHLNYKADYGPQEKRIDDKWRRS